MNKKLPATRGIPHEANKRPNAPPALRPETASNTVQPKVANSVVNRKPPVAPPVYRPQPVPKVLQTKRSPAQNLQASKAFAGPQVSRQSPAAPPAYRPGQRGIAQPMMVARLRSSSVVQRMEEKRVVDFSDDEESPNVDVRSLCKYPTIKGKDVWNNEEALTQHCLTYCADGKIDWVKFAYIAGAPPPELGHGSQLTKAKPKAKGKGGNKQGSQKDAQRWQEFQSCMETILELKYGHIKGKTPYLRAQKLVNSYDGDKPKWWL